MPEHVHLLLCPCQANCSMAEILATLKRPVSVAAKKHLILTDNQKWLQRLTVRKGTRKVFRFWLPGGGYDKNICHERPIEDVIDYIHANPVRRGLVDRVTDWQWSSARFYAGLRPVALSMDPLPPL